MTEAETEQLMDAVRKQVEYYFSKENLQSDAYLTSHMDANMTVAIATVMKVHYRKSWDYSMIMITTTTISDPIDTASGVGNERKAGMSVEESFIRTYT